VGIGTIIQQCQLSNKKAQKELYFLFAKKVYGICRRYSTDDQQAEDYMQDGFMKVFSNINAYDPNKGKFEAWLSRVVVNSILTEKRKKRRDRVYVELDESITDSVTSDPYEDDILDSIVKKVQDSTQFICF